MDLQCLMRIFEFEKIRRNKRSFFFQVSPLLELKWIFFPCPLIIFHRWISRRILLYQMDIGRNTHQMAYLIRLKRIKITLITSLYKFSYSMRLLWSTQSSHLVASSPYRHIHSVLAHIFCGITLKKNYIKWIENSEFPLDLYHLTVSEFTFFISILFVLVLDQLWITILSEIMFFFFFHCRSFLSFPFFLSFTQFHW